MEEITAIIDHSTTSDIPSAGYKIITNKQDIELLIDNEQDCCEDFGFFFCNEKPQDFVGAKLRGIELTDTALSKAEMQENCEDYGTEYFEGGIMFVDIKTNRGTLQFVAYNQHNGYYGHVATIRSTQLTHSECL